MFGISNLPPVRNGKFLRLLGGVSSTAGLLTSWAVPKSASMLFMMCVGGGGGGGGGLSGAAGTARGGGGGGGSGAISRLLIPAGFLPRILKLQPGEGGPGSVTAGLNGRRSAISGPASNSNFAADRILTSHGNSTAAGVGGTAGTAGGSNTGGVGEAAGVASDHIGAQLGLFAFVAGQTGSASGGIGSPGVALQYSASGLFISGGTGGGSASNNADVAGGAITGSAVVPTLAGGLAGGGDGNSGYLLEGIPFMAIGGTGGGSNGVAGVGGRGGNSAIGGGGGGGGGGVTGGAGGDGGPGMIYIAWW